MTVDTHVLISAAMRVLQHVSERSGGTIELSSEYYWDIPADVRYDTYDEPRGLTLGQLTFDWDVLQQVASGKEPVGCDLIVLGNILRALGELTIG